jgi:general secretion pathway protein B
MSYILDALRKTEHERKLGAVPTLAAEPRPVQPARPRTGPWNLAAVVLAGSALVIAAYSARYAGPPEALEPPASAAATAQSLPVVADAAGAPATVLGSPAARPEALQTALGGAAQPARPAPPAAAPAGTAPTPRSSAARGVMPRERPMSDGEAAEVDPSTSRSVGATQGSDGEQETEARSEAASTVPAVPAGPREGLDRAASPPEPSPIQQPPLLSELPSELQAALGRLRLSVHVYAPEPAERFVLLDMRKYREGERTPEGAQVEAITPQGLVLSYRGRLLRLARQP